MRDGFDNNFYLLGYNNMLTYPFFGENNSNFTHSDGIFTCDINREFEHAGNVGYIIIVLRIL